MWVGTTASDVLAWFTTLPDSAPLRTLDHRSRERFHQALTAELEQRSGPHGVFLTGTTWLVVTRRRRHQTSAQPPA